MTLFSSNYTRFVTHGKRWLNTVNKEMNTSAGSYYAKKSIVVSGNINIPKLQSIMRTHAKPNRFLQNGDWCQQDHHHGFYLTMRICNVRRGNHRRRTYSWFIANFICKNKLLQKLDQCLNILFFSDNVFGNYVRKMTTTLFGSQSYKVTILY